MPNLRHRHSIRHYRYEATAFRWNTDVPSANTTYRRLFVAMASRAEDDEIETMPLVKYPRSTSNGMSDFQAGVSLAKAIMGAGTFAMPWAFSQMGYVVGPLVLMMIMYLSVYSLGLLVTCARGRTSYVDVARGIFGVRGAFLAYSASISASIGVCGSYLVFMASTLHTLLPHISQNSYLLLLAPPAILLSSVRNVQRFAFTSLLGDISVVLGMVVVVIYGISYHKRSEDDEDRGLVAAGSFKSMPLGFGSIGYLFLVHFLSLPIESAMTRPERFPAVALVTFSFCGLLSVAFGLIGYLTFGNKTQQIVLLNVEGSFFITAVKLLLCCDLLFTYPVVMRPSIVIVGQSLMSSVEGFKSGRGNCQELGSMTYNEHLLVCVLLGIAASAGAVFVPAFGLLSGLVGGVSQTFLAFVLPPLMLVKQRQRDSGGSDLHGSLLELAVVNYSFKELGVVGLGAVLILWTMITTWNERRSA